MIEMVPENNEVVHEVSFEAKDINLEDIKTDIIPLEIEVPDNNDDISKDTKIIYDQSNEIIDDDDEFNEAIPIEDYIFNLEVNIKALNTTLEERDQQIKNLKEKNCIDDSTINQLSQRMEEKNQRNIEMEQMISSLNSTLILKDNTLTETIKDFDKQIEIEKLSTKMAIENYSAIVNNLKQSLSDSDKDNHKLQKKLECIDFIINSSK